MKEKYIGNSKVIEVPKEPIAFKIKEGCIKNKHLARESVSSENIQSAAVSSEKLAAGSVTTEKLANNSVTNSKIQDGTITNDKFLNGTITGDKIQDETIEGSKIKDNSIPGSKLADGSIESVDIKDNTLDGRKLVNNSIEGDKLADGAITNNKLKDNSIDGNKIADGTIQSLDIKDGTISGAKLANDTITNAKIADGAVTNNKIANNTIASDKIADGAITTIKIANGSVRGTSIADNAITNAKLQDDSIINRNIATGTLTGDKFADNTITGDKIINNTLPGSKIKDGTIENVDIKDNTLSGAKLVDNSISGSKIADNAITSSHLMNNSIPASKILDGTIESIDIKDGTLDGSKIKDNTITGAKLADNAVTSDKIPNSSITTDKIANLAVTEDKIGSSAVTNTKIANDAVTTDKINNGAITTDKILDNNITTAKIADEAVTTAKIANNSVTTDKIADLNVTTAKIANNAVTEAKLADGAITPEKIADSTITELRTIMDEVPISGSSKPVMSGGVYEALAGKQDTITDLGAIRSGVAKVGYYECDSLGNSAAKAISVDNYVLSTGGSMKVKMVNANTADNATLNINNTGAKPLYYAGERASSSNSWGAGETVEVYYDGTNFYANNVAGGSGSGDGAFDVSAKYPTSGVEGGNTYTLEGALTVLNANLPSSKKKGGMSIKFVQSSDNKYVRCNYLLEDATTNSKFTNVANWQGVDDEPTAGSDNLVKSGGVKECLDLLDIKHTNDQEFVRVSDKIAIQGYYNTNSGWNVGNIVSPTVISNRNSAIYNIPVYAGDVYLIKLRNNYSYSWYALLDSNNRLLEKSTDNAVGLKEKTICIEKDGTLVINLYEGVIYFNELYIAKQSIVQKERLYDISVNGDTVIKYNGTVDIPVTNIIREVEQKGASAVVSKTITSEDLLDKGFYGAFYLVSNKIIYNEIPANETVETNRCIKEYCKGFRYIYLQPNNYTDQYFAGTFVDKEGNFVKILSWNFDAVPQVDGTYRVEVPESAEYAYIWTYGNKETFDAFEAKMEMIIDAPNAEEAPKYKMYKKNVSNGLLSLFNQFESELIPVEYLDTIEVKTIHNFYYIRAYDENRTQIDYVDIVDGSNYSEEDGVKKYVFGIYSQQIKYFNVGLKRKAYGFLTNQLTNTEISIYKGDVSTNSIFSQKDMYYLGKQFRTYSSPASSSFGTPIFKVEPFDTIKHLAFHNKTIGVDLGCLGLYFYDDAFNIIGYGEKTGENGTYVTDTVPDGAVYGQFINYNRTVTDDVVCTINRTSKTKEFVNTRNDVRSTVPFSRVIQENKGAELIDVGNEKNLYVGYTSNCSSLITSNGSYLIFGGWAEVYRYNTPMGSVLWMKKSTDKGRTWSKMKVLFDTISFTPDSQHIVYMHSPSAVVNKNGRILLQFTLDNTDAVNTTMGDVDGANVKPEKRVCLIYSDDDGESWSEITDLTKYIIAKYSSIYSLYGSYGRCCCANGILAYSFYKFKAESSETAKGFLMYSSDDGETWSCTDAVTGLNNEISLCEGGDNNILVLVRGSQGSYNKKEVYWINAANGLGELIHDENLSNSRIFDEAAGMGEEGEFGEVKRIRLNDHYAYLFAMQADDTRNVTLFVSHDLKKFIPVCNLMTIVPAIRAYSFMDVKEHEILCCNRTSDKVIVHICGGVYSQIESVGISEDVKKAIAPITFSAEDDAATLATKMNSLVALMQSNGYMKDWRDYTNKMSYACEAQPNKPYDSFTKAATNQGVMYAFKKVEGYFRIRITLPAQNVTSNATTVKFATTWNSGASLHSYNAPIVSRDEEFVVAEYEGNGLAYGEALFVWFYDGVAQSAITTDGIKVEIFE